MVIARYPSPPAELCQGCVEKCPLRSLGMCRFKVPTHTVKSLCRYPFRYIWSLSLRSYKVLPICSSTSAFNRASITFSTSFLLASPFRFCLILLYWKNRYDSFLFTPTYCTQSPNTKDILTELNKLQEKKNTLMQEYSSSKSTMNELYKIRKNYGIYMGKDMEK